MSRAHFLRPFFFLVSLVLFTTSPLSADFSSQQEIPPASALTEETSHPDLKTSPPSFQALFVKTMVLVFFLLALATAGLFLLKKVQFRGLKSQGQPEIALIEKRSLSPKTTLFLLSIKGKDWVVIESANQVQFKSIGEKIEKVERS